MRPKPQLTAETKYQLLERISHDIRNTLEVDETLNHLLVVLKSILPYDAAGIFVRNRGQVYPRSSHPHSSIAGIAMQGYDPHPVETDLMLMEGLGLIGHVIHTGESRVVPDVSRDPHYVVGRKSTRSEIIVPILQGERTVGALNAESDQLGFFDEADLETLRFFARAAAISISKAMLHQNVLEKERLEKQLHDARMVQARLLPAQAPAVRGYEIAGLCIPTYEIGGDYFDWIPLADQRLGCVVADVAGKGIPAALIMAVFRALLRIHARSSTPLASMMQGLNRHLGESTGRSSFVTSFYGVLDPPSGRFEYVNCGHCFPLLLRNDGSLEELKKGGCFLGAFSDLRYESAEVRLSPGDMLVMYTDGVVETENAQEEVFEVSRLEALVRTASGLPVQRIIEKVRESSESFRGREILDDDFTLVILKRENDFY